MWQTVINKLTNTINIIPINDIRTHIESKDCHCNPKITDDGIIVHRAYDLRDLYESLEIN